MEVGVGTIVYEFAGVPLEEAIDRIDKFGIKYLDVLAFGDYNPAVYPKAKQLEIAKKLESKGMRASSIVSCGEGNLASNDPKERAFCVDQLKLAAKLVRTLGGQQILVGKGAGNVDYDLPRKEAWQNVVVEMKNFCKWCKNENILVTMELEPEPLHVLNSAEAMAQMIEDVGEENLFANIDIGHLNILRTPPTALTNLKGKIIHAHISETWVLPTPTASSARAMRHSVGLSTRS